ncbi:MAG: CRISPR-associated endonuclease Cas3'', partial [Clostridiales bacterium]|nr:CRISPR-associated endonuclease Cas3'' [Clostridiales bacterium]
MQYYAHSNGTNDKNKWQTLEEHLMNVAELTEEFASKFGVNGIGYNIGLFHDIGKSQENMIKRLSGENIKVVHSSGGAQSLEEYMSNKSLLKMCQEVIASHHGGLKNFGLSTDVDNGTTYAMLNKN